MTLKSLSAVFVLYACMSAVCAEQVNTDFFSINLPDTWDTQNETIAYIVSKGNEGRVNMEMYPDFAGYYCIYASDPRKGKHVDCPTPCSEETLERLLGGSRAPKSFKIAGTKKTQQKNGNSEYTSAYEITRQRGVNKVDRVATAVSLSCRKNGQFYFSLSTTSDLDKTEKLFNEIKSSIKWK
ncbi:MAG: hypothetical protein JWL63_2401 [Rhodocyclales bacterium]|nr:hypothetical protein [Rhodocyclales bacterium]